MAVSTLAKAFDVLTLVFFIVHIPITLFIDSQAVLPQEWFPAWAIQASKDYERDYGDFLIKELPPWFKVLVLSEVFLQLPFFFVAAYAYAFKRNWIWKPCIVYSLFVASTMVPMLAEFAFSPRSDYNRWACVAFYLPFFLVPLGIAFRMLSCTVPFEPTVKARVKRY